MPAGRPSFVPTAEQRKKVEAFAAAGILYQEIAGILGVNHKTLVKHFALELELGRAKANATIAGRLYAKAMAGDTIAMMFWLKCRGHWRERQREDDVATEQPNEAMTKAERIAEAQRQMMERTIGKPTPK